jgi:hypothetical protein
MKHQASVLLLLLFFGACTDLDDETSAEALAVDDFEAQIAFYCPGIDRAAGVPDYRGLTGTYVRLGLPAADEPYRLSLAVVPDPHYTIGPFTGLRGTAAGTVAPYAGSFLAFPDNPAIGAAIILDLGADGRYDETWFTLGLGRSFSGLTIQRICLAGREHPFLLTRTYF